VRLLRVSLVARVILLEVCTIICVGVYRHLVSGHEISIHTAALYLTGAALSTVERQRRHSQWVTDVRTQLALFHDHVVEMTFRTRFHHHAVELRRHG